MKKILLALFVMVSVTSAMAQQVNISFRNQTLVSATRATFEVWAAAGVGYVTSDQDVTNPSGSWSALTIRFDIDIPSTTTLSSMSVARNSAVVVTASTNINPTPTGTSTTNSDGGVSFTNPGNTNGDFTTTYVLLGTVTMNFSTTVTAANILTLRQSQAQVPDPTSWWTTNGAPGVDLPLNMVTAFVLPVSFTSLTGVASGCSANLAWATASEQNSKTYAIEYGTDGKTFATVGTVASKNSALGNSYTFSYGNLGNVTGYFRIKAVDFDGTFAYSGIITVSGNGGCSAGMLIKVSPNPTTNLVNIQGLVTGSHVSLIDAGGKTLSEVMATGTNQAIYLSTYASGVYTLKIQKADGSITNVKVVKQ